MLALAVILAVAFFVQGHGVGGMVGTVASASGVKYKINLGAGARSGGGVPRKLGDFGWFGGGADAGGAAAGGAAAAAGATAVASSTPLPVPITQEVADDHAAGTAAATAAAAAAEKRNAAALFVVDAAEKRAVAAEERAVAAGAYTHPLLRST